MKISVLTLFPQLYVPFLSTSLIGRARDQQKVAISTDDYFSYCVDHERVDAPTFGHGAGMVMKPEVVERAIEAHKQQDPQAITIFFSPQGKRLDQFYLKELHEKIAAAGGALLVTSRYEGMDERVQDHYADEVVSIGDYVLMGGDIPAMAFIEGLLRLVPGVVGKESSVEEESFSGPFLDYPEYGAPVSWKGYEVPEVIRSGNHGKIDTWRKREATRKTVQQRFDWLRMQNLSSDERKAVAAVIPSHYCALMHTQICLPGDQIGTTSVTSIDVHDIARSACTYNIAGYFVVTPLEDQKKIINRLHDFWMSDVGVSYNPQRHRAIELVSIVDELEDAIRAIELKEGKRPLVIATSAQDHGVANLLSYNDQGEVFKQERPVLLLFGTGHGLAPAVLEMCDYVLCPIEGFSDFNHLSVRSAAAIVFDRWLGLNPAHVKTVGR